MSEAINTSYLECLLKSWQAKPAESRAWLNQLRAQAIDCVSTQKLPTKRDEEWRFTDISPLNTLPYRPSQPDSALKIEDIQHLFLNEAKNRLVFVDGHFSQSLSVIAEPAALIAGNLSALLSTQASILESHLG